MTKEQINKLFEKLKELKDKESIISEAFEKFCRLVSDNQNDGFIVESQLEGFLKAIDILEPDLGEEFSWYVYEKGNSNWYDYGDIKFNGRQYLINTDKEYLEYLKNEYSTYYCNGCKSVLPAFNILNDGTCDRCGHKIKDFNTNLKK